MDYIKNYNSLATSNQRRIVLDLIEAAIFSIQPENILDKNFALKERSLQIQNQTVDISAFDRIFLLGFGKGSANISSIIEQKLGDQLTEGYVIDLVNQHFQKIQSTLGTHPLPSQINFDFTQKIINRLSNLTEKNLVIIVTCGGGSALFEKPISLSLEEITSVNKVLLKSGANIYEMNVIRKHLSQVKGGGLAKILFPATIINLIFSDVLGNNFSTIASGPTVKDPTTILEAIDIYKKFHLDRKTSLSETSFIETPKENRYFEKVTNILMVSNLTALSAMQQKAQDLNYSATIYSDKFAGVAKDSGSKLIAATTNHSVLLAGGETTVTVQGKGQGGRSQELVLASLPYLKDNEVVASFGTDGWDNTPAAGAIGDFQTLEKSKNLGLDPQKFLAENNSYAFFQKVEDAIVTGRLPSNVSDLMIVFKK